MLVILDFGLGLIVIPPLVNCGVLEPLLQAFVGVLGKEMITYGIVWFGMVFGCCLMPFHPCSCWY